MICAALKRLRWILVPLALTIEYRRLAYVVEAAARSDCKAMARARTEAHSTSFGNIAFSFRLSAMICAALKRLRWILVPLALNATITVNIS
jgi:hypothetical protein